ncbi:hypothetical protein TrVE_jg5007 [Triparma verrucosa]|uniref:Uncharacterized protein n=1 Tax=Triparma verrucosa TaxID=1606542 RepID=A0A9W7CN60_9STRA|nr:hypothetical protein TrVE_jg5007 [Triparma verrucosa]
MSATVSSVKLASLVFALLTVGMANTLSYKVCYAVYGEKYAYFVSNGINALYVVFGGCILYPRYCKNEIPKELLNQPQYKFVVMALLDAFGTFFSAMGSVHTPGYLQTILNQTLIPILMLVSFFALGTRFSISQVTGATLIVSGALISSFDSLLDSGSSQPLPLGSKISIFFYLVSNIPYAFSAVYKEVAFKNQKTDVMYLTQQVSIYQLIVGLCMMPLTSIPGVASQNGMPVTEAAQDLVDGTRCYFQLPHSGCGNLPTFALLTGYCLLNFIYNTLGLFLTKYASSTVNAITSSLLLPISAVAFTAPWMGQFRENIAVSTYYGLVIIILGFLLYQYGSKSTASDVLETPKPYKKQNISGEEMNSLLRGTQKKFKAKRAMRSPKPVASFQERMVGINIRHGMKTEKGAAYGGCVGGTIDLDTPEVGGAGAYGSLVETGSKKPWPGMRTSTSFSGLDMAFSI